MKWYIKRNSWDCEALLCVVKTFLLLAVGIIHTAPDHPTSNAKSILICSRDRFGTMFAVTDVCPKKAPMLLTVTYVVFTHKRCYWTHEDLPDWNAHASCLLIWGQSMQMLILHCPVHNLQSVNAKGCMFWCLTGPYAASLSEASPSLLGSLVKLIWCSSDISKTTAWSNLSLFLCSYDFWLWASRVNGNWQKRVRPTKGSSWH